MFLLFFCLLVVLFALCHLFVSFRYAFAVLCEFCLFCAIFVVCSLLCVCVVSFCLVCLCFCCVVCVCVYSEIRMMRGIRCDSGDSA